LGTWEFKNIKSWIDKVKDSKKKTKLMEALKIFKNHKVPNKKK